MFGRKPKDVTVKLDEAITRIMQEMDTVGPLSPEYPKLIGHLQKMLPLEKQQNRQRVSPDTRWIVFGNLFGILVIVVYEQKHVFVSKAISFIRKPQ